MYEWYMVEHIELEIIPVTLCVETTLTGVQDTAVWPTVGSLLPDTDASSLALFDPTSNSATLATALRVCMAKKGARIVNGRQSLTIRSDVCNTLLLKQEAPMLRTNGSVGGRERYGDEAGAIVIIPAR